MTTEFDEQEDPGVHCAADLLALSLDELDDLFTGGAMPEEEEIRGEWNPLIVAWAMRSALPEAARRLWSMLASSPLMPWKSAVFEFDEEAMDLAGHCTFPAGLKGFYFEAGTENSMIDDEDCLFLDYNIESNLFLLRGFRDEVRQLSPGLLLGRGCLVSGEDLKLVCYFALERD